MTDHRIIRGNRRFTCLSPSLVRIEYAPSGCFSEQRSVLAYPQQQPLPFAAVGQDAGWDVLKTAQVEIRSCRNDRACDRTNMEIRWSDGRLLQFWRPDDRDHHNLGGALRSLDMYNQAAAALDGVHPAGMESFDVSGTAWPAWIVCEVDPLLKELHPKPPANLNQRNWLQATTEAWNDGSFLERSFNWYKEVRKFCPGVLSASGYCFLNDSTSAVLDADDFPIERSAPGAQDWYFSAYGTDYRRALSDFRLLSGPAPLPRHKSLGIMFSRWPAFSETEVAEMGRDFTANGYPMSTLVMDMEWHKEGWGHWEFSPELLPDPPRFLALCRSFGVDVVFNDHPLDVREDDVHFAPYLAAAGPEVEVRVRSYNGKELRMAKVDICDKRQNQAFREVCHAACLRLGIDYWWNDGSRGQMSATSGQLVANKVFFEESQRDGRRGMLLARYGGLGSHRYGVFFTGDANSDYDVLKTECEFTIRAGGVGISAVSHDIGGFGVSADDLTTGATGAPIMSPLRYLRWLQFGVFNPILRFHSAPGCGSRRPYDYDPAVGGACRHWLRVRHSLLPYIYTATRVHHDSGVPLVRGMFLDEPRNPQAYRWDQYWFGPDLVVAPMLSVSDERVVYLPSGSWWEFSTDQRCVGGSEFTRQAGPAEVPVYVRAGAIIPSQSADGDLHAAHVAELILDVYADAEGAGELYEDDGAGTGYLDGAFVRTSFALRQESGVHALTGGVSVGSPLAAMRQVTVRVHHPAGFTAASLSGHGALSLRRMSASCQEVRMPSLPSAETWRLELL